MSGITYTYRTGLSNGHILIDLATDHGTTLAAIFNTSSQCQLWRSTDGGVTWTSVASLASGGTEGTLVYGGVNGGGGKVWYLLGHTTATDHYSTDDGVTWTSYTNSLGGQVNAAAWDGSSTVVCVADNATSAGESAVNQSTSPTSYILPSYYTTNNQACNNRALIWDGAQFVMLSTGTNTGVTVCQISTAPSGFLQSAGPTWTKQAQTQSNTGGPIFLFSGVVSPPSIFYNSFFGYVALLSNGTSFIAASTPAGLATGTPVSISGIGSPVSGLCLVNGACVTGVSSAVFHSLDLSTWTQDSLSQAFASGESFGSAVFDSVNSSIILLGSGNPGTISVYTAPAFIQISPTSATVTAGTNYNFSVTATGSVTWSCLYGSITSSGVYTAPSSGHTTDTVTVALSSNSGVFATAAITVVPVSLSISPTSATVPIGGSQQTFVPTASPSYEGVVWSVNGIVGGDGIHGTIANGVYTSPLNPATAPPSVTVTGALVDYPGTTASSTVTLTVPTLGGGGGPVGQTPNFLLAAKARFPQVFPCVLVANAGTITPQLHVPAENNNMKVKP